MVPVLLNPQLLPVLLGDAEIAALAIAVLVINLLPIIFHTVEPANPDIPEAADIDALMVLGTIKEIHALKMTMYALAQNVWAIP